MLTEPQRRPSPTPPTETAAATRSDDADLGHWTIHVVADSDTRWKWGAAIANRLHPTGDAEVHGHLLQGRATPNARQLADVGATAASIRTVGLAALVADLADTDADVVVLSAVGGTIQSLLQGLTRAWAGRTRRPMVVTGYVGLVYEKLIDGLLLRAGADVLLANSAHDERAFREVLSAVGADPDLVVRTALPFLGGAPYDASEVGVSRPFTVSFVAQPSVPNGLEERRYALRQTIEHARRHPDRHVILKLRGRVGEQTTHVERHHFADLLAEEGRTPDNFEIAYGSMAAVLDRTDLCLTVSSTAALEAMHRGIPTGILTDFGVRETLGNHAFLYAGVYTSWPALHEGLIPEGEPGWAADNGVRDPNPYAAVHARMVELIARSEHAPLTPWFDLGDAGGYLPALLQRNGLKPDGSPLMGDPAAVAASTGKRLVSAAAQRLYRVAVRSVEPRVRKWAQL